MPAVEGKIEMAARRQVTNKLRDAYRGAAKHDKARILDEVMATTGMGRSTARRMLTGAALPDPREQVDLRRLRPKGYSDESRLLLVHVWALMGCPCGKYLRVMLELWLPLLEEAGDLDRPFATPATIAELRSMSPATIDRYLAPARRSMQLRGISTTKPSPLLRNSIGLSKVGDEPAKVPGVVEADTVAHCGPTFAGEFARTLTMTDLVTGWTENASVRNNAARWIVAAVADLQGMFPFPLRVFDSDNGSEFINHDVADWLQERDIAQTRSRPYKKNDQATIESKNNHLVRRYGFYHRYDTATELALLNQLWPLVNDRLNFFTPTKKPEGWATDTVGRRKRLYDKPRSPYQRLLAAGVLNPAQETELAAYKATLKPVAMQRRITEIQQELTRLAGRKTARLEQHIAWKAPDPAGLKTRAS